MSNANDIPQHAAERLQELRSQNNPKGVFTSDFSVNEFLLVKEAGFEPLGLVVGSCIYHIGFQQARWSKNEEMEVLSQAMYHARELAMSRMEEEAIDLGADGVVGVRLVVNRHEWGEDMAEFMAIGTAVVANPNNQRNWKAKGGKPFTSDLSGQDFWTLLKSGYRPLSMVMGSCVYHVAHQSLRQSLKSYGQNTELVNYTQALYDARELAMERMQHEAHEEDAEGVVGVILHEGSHCWGSHVIEFFSIGTAVSPIQNDHHIPTPTLVLPLND